MSRTVLVTGTSTGIGAACAERLADAGWTVFAGVRRVQDGERLAGEISGDVRPVLLDVTDARHISAVAAQLEVELGAAGLDALVNNAGLAEGAPIELLTIDEWRRHFEVNVFGLVEVTRAFLPLLLRAEGRVVNIGSVAGRVGMALAGPYCAGKHAVEAISEVLRLEVEPLGMRVVCVEPGEVATAIWDKSAVRVESVVRDAPPEVLSRYDRQLDTMYGFVSEGARRGIAPMRVAEVVHRALTEERPRLRYLVGPDAALVGLIDRLPDRLRRRALALNDARLARVGRTVRARGRF